MTNNTAGLANPRGPKEYLGQGLATNTKDHFDITHPSNQNTRPCPVGGRYVPAATSQSISHSLTHLTFLLHNPFSSDLFNKGKAPWSRWLSESAKLIQSGIAMQTARFRFALLPDS
jgi:hypothetical protein